MTTLVVSPHLDDAVLSLPGFIHTRAQAGERVVVLTVFSEGDRRHAGRRAEDLAALAQLGAAAVHLGLQDAPERRGVACNFHELVLRPLNDDDPDAAAVRRVLVDHILGLAPTLTVLPLGVGEHIDHRIVHASHNDLAGPLAFYADRPYADVRHAIAARLLRLGATVDGAALTPGPAAVAEFLAAARTAPHLRAYLPVDGREACLHALAAPLRAASPATGLHLRHEQPGFPAATRRAAIAAVQAYTSQLPDLFGATELAQAFADPYRERLYWRSRGASSSIDSSHA